MTRNASPSIDSTEPARHLDDLQELLIDAEVDDEIVQQAPGLPLLDIESGQPQQPPRMLTSPCSAHSCKGWPVWCGCSSYWPMALGRPALG